MSNNTKAFGTSGAWRGWRELGGDVNWEEYGGKWGRQDPNNASVFYVIRHDDLFEAMGERDTTEGGYDRYTDSVYRVDLSEVPESEIASAFECCGFDPDECEYSASNLDWVKVECLVDYGVASPMGEHSDPHYPERARAAARRAVEELIADSAQVEAMLDRPVNAIGSTARDFGKGDVMAGLDRYKRAKESASLSVNMRTVPSDDPLAYVHGYQTGATGGGLPADREDLAPAWLEGHELGRKVLAGDTEPPTWAKPAATNPAMELMAKLHN